jgi:TatD DNase family protein
MKQPVPPLPLLPPDVELIDTHCHLDMEAYQPDLDAVLSSAIDNGIRRIVTIGIDVNSSHRAVTLANHSPHVYATVGIHPHDAQQATIAHLDRLAELAQDPVVVGYGEIGLDYVKNYAPQDVQRSAFRDQLHLAKELHLPVVIHDREAHLDTLDMLRAAGPFPAGGVMHCFSGDIKLAEAVLDLGFYISIPGVVTFHNARLLHDVIRSVDLTRLLLETDGPFLAPAPYRGKRNEPTWMLYTAQKVAELQQISLEEVARVTTTNAEHLFHLQETRHAHP